jgi:hypothetical protein
MVEYYRSKGIPILFSSGEFAVPLTVETINGSDKILAKVAAYNPVAATILVELSATKLARCSFNGGGLNRAEWVVDEVKIVNDDGYLDEVYSELQFPTKIVLVDPLVGKKQKEAPVPPAAAKKATA